MCLSIIRFGLHIEQQKGKSRSPYIRPLSFRGYLFILVRNFVSTTISRKVQVVPTTGPPRTSLILRRTDVEDPVLGPVHEVCRGDNNIEVFFGVLPQKGHRVCSMDLESLGGEGLRCRSDLGHERQSTFTSYRLDYDSYLKNVLIVGLY